MDVTPILDGLNEAQRQAVTAPSAPTLVIAGAGSGKTRVLVHRAAWLIDVEGLSPQGLLAVTFTNKAAAEMRNRIEALGGGTAAEFSNYRLRRSAAPGQASLKKPGNR
jgi:DNA helicase-2/ATP-dependent DNA helicase PcrA